VSGIFIEEISMNRIFGSLFMLFGLTAALTSAQGHNGPGGPGTLPRANSGLNVGKQQVVQGTISSVQIAYGAQYPSIVINNTQIKVAPAWYLLENDFELAAGETVSVMAAPSNTANDSYLYAIDITKTASGSKITLRNELGVPIWMGAARRGGNTQAPRTGGYCVDTASILTVTGTIDRVNSGAGIQNPSLALKVNDALRTIGLGPERILLDTDLELKPGATLTVKYARSACAGEYIALQLVDAAGHSLVLRHDDGTPAWND